MTKLTPRPDGNFSYLTGSGTYSRGVVADKGFTLVHATLRAPLPLAQGFKAITAHLESIGRPAQAFCGAELRIAAPKAYQPDAELVRKAGGSIHCTEDLDAAASGADVLYTDVWVSMGKEAEGAQRLKDLAGYQINDALVRRANPGALVMHCLPAYRGKEITEETLEAHAETIFREAENRLHTQKAIVDWMVR